MSDPSSAHDRSTYAVPPALAVDRQAPDRNLALELVRVTEAAAMAAGRWVGRGDKNGGDGAAVDAMRALIGTVSMRGVVVIGEGEKDEAPMLFNGEEIGDGSPPRVDIAVDPLEGTRLCAQGRPGALAVIALSERGTMFDPGPCVYMEKLVGGPEIADCLSLEIPVGDVVKRVAERRGVSPTEITTVILDRERHNEGVRQIREAGSRIRFITDGDVSAALLAVTDGTGVDLLWGIGGTPEGVISAAAIKCLGGQILGRLWPRDDEELKAATDAGYEIDRVLTVDDLVGGNDAFFAATGVTDGDLLQGVRYRAGHATTESLVMRSRSGTTRTVHASHDQAKLREITGGLYG
jgi:fructose-1,6-bisphosphatase II